MRIYCATLLVDFKIKDGVQIIITCDNPLPGPSPVVVSIGSRCASRADRKRSAAGRTAQRTWGRRTRLWRHRLATPRRSRSDSGAVRRSRRRGVSWRPRWARRVQWTPPDWRRSMHRPRSVTTGDVEDTRCIGNGQRRSAEWLSMTSTLARRKPRTPPGKGRSRVPIWILMSTYMNVNGNYEEHVYCRRECWYAKFPIDVY